ncbi:MAG: hypothetical protein BZ133_06175 [Methanosphaera sp. SHI613]|jgi:hypothetical protein|nr:MAG: hypothetical protein BZ133_06175 [Methanosphaera sp. SHI613]
MNYKNLLIISLLIFSVGISCCSSVSAGTFEQNGVRFDYPDDWHQVKSIAEGSVAAISYSNDSSISILIQQVPSEYGSTLEEAYAENNKRLALMPGYTNIQENKTTIKNKNLTLHRYIVSDVNGLQKEHIATWTKMSDGKTYVILYSAPVENYEQYKGAYDEVVETFALESDPKESIVDQIFNLFN